MHYVLLTCLFSIGIFLLVFFQLFEYFNKYQMAVKTKSVANNFFYLTEQITSFVLIMLLIYPLIHNFTIELLEVEIIGGLAIVALIEMLQRIVIKANKIKKEV